MPDPLGHADLRWWTHCAPKLPALLAELERAHYLNPAGVEWGSRKHDRSPRRMVEHNEFAEVHLHLALTQAPIAIVEQQSDLVLVGRLLWEPRMPGRSPVLTTSSHRAAHGIYRRRKRDLIRRNPHVGIKTDIRLFYPSVKPRVVGDVLLPLVGVSIASDVRLTLEKYAIDSGVPGLPIGPESSAWFGNLLLADGDRALERHVNVEPLRWMDDLYQLDGTPGVVENSHSDWTQAIAKRGLTFSIPKTKRSWELGISGGQLLAGDDESHGDITAAAYAGDVEEIAGRLFDELRSDHPNASRLNHLFGTARNDRFADSHLAPTIIDYMLSHPEKWECSCPRAVGYMKRFANSEQCYRMIEAAHTLITDGLGASEQVIALYRAATGASAQFPGHRRVAAAQSLLDSGRANDCVPLRTRARYAAWRLDMHHVQRQTIETGEFDDLHPFEQRIAISFADPRCHHWWLEKQVESGRWPITAKWRLNKR